jgi:Ca2+-binding EF-hand superfamily protein
MNINKKQLIEQLRYLADNDPKQLKEILNELNVGNMTIEESEAAYEQNIKNKELRELAKESFDRFDKVYKALS